MQPELSMKLPEKTMKVDILTLPEGTPSDPGYSELSQSTRLLAVGDFRGAMAFADEAELVFKASDEPDSREMLGFTKYVRAMIILSNTTQVLRPLLVESESDAPRLVGRRARRLLEFLDKRFVSSDLARHTL